MNEYFGYLDKLSQVDMLTHTFVVIEEEVAAPSQAELEAGRAEWGIKYNDECLKFEKEWEIIANAV